MANFAKKLEEASDEELYSWVNELSPNYTPLASDELTRRRIQKLAASINKLNDSTEKYSQKSLYLSFLLYVIALMQIIVVTLSIPLSWLLRGLILLAFMIVLFLTERFLFRVANNKKIRI